MQIFLPALTQSQNPLVSYTKNFSDFKNSTDNVDLMKFFSAHRIPHTLCAAFQPAWAAAVETW